MRSLTFCLALFAFASCLAADFECTRVFRPARLSRDMTNLATIQPIDEASWIGLTDGEQDEVEVLVFRKSFDVGEGDDALTIDVSADERFYLTCDGRFIARGPNRGTIENWQYQTYKLTLAPGRHELKAVVASVGKHAPRAQLSYRRAFILKADGVYDKRLTTGVAAWDVGRFTGMKAMGFDNEVFGAGEQYEVAGSGPYAVEITDWKKAEVVRGPVNNHVGTHYGVRTKGWMLFPAQLPDQTEDTVRPGSFRAATHAAEWKAQHVYTQAETQAAEVAAYNDLLAGRSGVVVPPRTRLQLAWHLGRYICAYPVLKVGKGKGARVSWTWTESSRDAQDKKRKGDRAAIVGKFLQGYGDTFRIDGRNAAEFSAPWFRCGLWCRIDIETQDEPLEIRDISLIESRYPLEMESVFESADDPSLQDIRRISLRAMQMCCHEMLFDCPYYEQQMYPGDTRIQLNVLRALNRDERMIKRAIEMYDLATRDNGQCPFNWPTTGTQEGYTYTLCYLCMYGDYVMNHTGREWLRARMPGMRKSLAGCELYENAEGLVENTPCWNFMDWAVGWDRNTGLLPNSDFGRKMNAFVNLYWLMAMQSAEKVERAMGNGLLAQYWAEKAAKLKGKIVEKFWNEKRGLLADLADQKTYSEHIQVLALLTDALPKDKAATCFAHLITDEDLVRTTVYFSYYLFEAYFKMGRPDLVQKRFDLWRGYVAKHITTLSEMPDTPTHEGRSDCHAWGAHPIWFMQTGFAGIHSDAPFFARVRVAPQPGTLTKLKARHPHPQGWIEVDLSFDSDRAKGVVNTPVAGTFSFGGRSIPLKAGKNIID